MALFLTRPSSEGQMSKHVMHCKAWARPDMGWEQVELEGPPLLFSLGRPDWLLVVGSLTKLEYGTALLWLNGAPLPFYICTATFSNPTFATPVQGARGLDNILRPMFNLFNEGELEVMCPPGS